MTNGPQGVVPMVSLNYSTASTAPIRYGAQPPQLDHPSPLVLMEDRDDPARGPAYMFVEFYNKTVILREDDLPGGYTFPKRSLLERGSFDGEAVEKPTYLHERDDSTWETDSIAQPTDKPWYCFWNGTVLEGFVFIAQNANTSASENTTSPSVVATSESYSSPSAAATSETYSQGMNQPYRKRQASPSLCQYPKMVKIEERRLQYNPVQPYCQQMQILNTGQPGPLQNPVTGDFIIVNLTESEPPLQHQAQEIPGGEGGPSGPWNSIPTAGGQGRRRSYEKRDSLTPCQCEWSSGL